MHAAVGVVSLFALFTISQTSYINKLLFGTPVDSSLKINDNRRTRKRKGHNNSSSPGTIHGLVNTGNTCFLNSVLQALSSSTYLYKYLNSSPIITYELDLTKLTLDPDEFPVTNALFKTMKVLNMLVDHSKAAYPTEVVHSLQDKMRITTYEQQDAQELFQILSDALNEEENIVVQQGRSNSLLDIDVLRGLVEENNRNSPGRLGGWPTIMSQGSAPNGRRDPLHGLLASRLSCVQCGYTAAIRHFAFNNISLSLPFRASCTLEECLLSYITIESLQDVVCRKCSLQTTLKKAEDDERCINQRRKNPGKGKSKPKLCPKDSSTTLRIQKLKQVLKYNIEEELGSDFPIERVVSHHCTKQVMFAKPPQVLCLHLNRSAYFPNGSISKNPCKVKFPEFLDLSPFCTTGHLVLGPQSPLSIPDSGSYPRHIYRLQAVIVHYGSHSYGHFVTYRRKPSTEIWNVRTQNGDSIPPHLTNSLTFFNSSPTEWFQVSDQSVLAADKLDVLSSNPYMLLYEAVPVLPLELEPQRSNVPVPLVSDKESTERIISSPSPSPSPSTSSPGPPTPRETFPSEADFIAEGPHPALSSSLTSSSQLSGNSNSATFDRLGEIHLPD